MARPKEFDRDTALSSAMGVFWRRGYEAASTDELLSAMRIGRQSMYDTFGDKHKLFVDSLRCYHETNGGALGRFAVDGMTPIQVIGRFLGHFADQTVEERQYGCMGINATTTFGQSSPDVTALARRTAETSEAIIERQVRAAQEQGELAATIDPRQAAEFLYATLQGLTVRAQAGASDDELRRAADFAMRALKAMS